MKRRDILSASLALPFAGMAQADTSADTPIQRLFGEWEHWHRESCHGPEEQSDYCINRMSELEERLCALPSENAHDLACKIVALTSYFNFMIEDRAASPLCAEINQLAKVG